MNRVFIIQARVTKNEMDRIGNEAKESGMKLSDWVRSKLLVPEKPKEHIANHFLPNELGQPIKMLGDYTKKEKHKSFQQYMNEMADLQYEPEFKKMASDIIENPILSQKQKDLLIKNMNQSKL